MSKSKDGTVPSVHDVVICVSEIDREAEQLLSRHNGIHNMHGARAGIGHTRYAAENGKYTSESYDSMATLDVLIRKMRFCDVNGSYPRKQDVEKREIRRWQDVGR